MERSNIHVLLGILTDTVGITRRKEGLLHRESAKRFREHHFNAAEPDGLSLEDEIRYFNTVTDLACSHQQFNRYDEIEATCQMVKGRYKSWGTPEEFPYEFAKYYHHMAFVLAYIKVTPKLQCNMPATQPVCWNSVEFGLLVTLFRFDCATLYFQNGQTEKAITEHKEVLQLRLLKLGKSNIMTIQSHIVLGAIYYFDHDYTNAEIHMSEALRQCTKRDVSREATVRAQFYISLILKHSVTKTRLEESQRLDEDARLGMREMLALDYLDFLRDRGDDDPILYDYLAPWTTRVVVEHKTCQKVKSS